MGNAQRTAETGSKKSDFIGWGPHNPGSSGQYERFLEAGKATRFVRTISDPSIGDRFGNLTVIGQTEPGKSGRVVPVRCDCGAPSHWVTKPNLLKGASTRCNKCARAKTAAYRKMFYCYADAMPDDEHRRRLLNRISAAIGRCHNPKQKQFDSYGQRGIEVCQEWRNDKRAFLRHVQTVPGWDDPALDMDRADCNGNYEPGNIRFITRRANALNKRKINDVEAELRAWKLHAAALEQRLRSCRCGAAAPVHNQD